MRNRSAVLICHIAREMLSRRLAPRNTNTTSSPHEEQERATRGPDPQHPQQISVMIYYHIAHTCPILFLTRHAIQANISLGCNCKIIRENLLHLCHQWAISKLLTFGFTQINLT